MLKGLVGEENKRLTKTQFPIGDIEDIQYLKLNEIGKDGENIQKHKIEIDKLTLFFPNSRFHFGSAVYKFKYYIKFLIKYSKKYYRNLLIKEFPDNCKKSAEIPEYDHGIEVEIKLHNSFLHGDESIISVKN